MTPGALRWGRRAHPLLFAVFPVVALAAQNPGRFVVRDALVLCGVAAIVVAAALGAFHLLLRRAWPEESADVAAFATLVGVALFYLYPVLRWEYQHVAHPAKHAALVTVEGLVPILVVALIGGLAHAARQRLRMPQPSRVGRVLTAAGMVVVALAVAHIVVLRIVAMRAIRRSVLVRQLASPVPTRAAAVRLSGDEPKRDVYVLILDEYASADVLRERFAFDNHAFEDSLRALGFRIPASVRSNYAVTTLSVPSLLNFAHMQPLADVMPPDSRDWSPATYLLVHNRAARFLKARGYRYLFFPARGFAPTQANMEADEQYAPYGGFDLGRALYGSELATELVANTPLARLRGFVRPYDELRLEHVARTLDGLMALPSRPEPKFVVAHTLMPHVPYVVDATCRPLASPSWDRSDLAGQVQCVNRLTLRVVRTLIAESAVPPIIIIQGDHGTQSLDPFGNAPGELSVAQARERFRALGAYFLPSGGDRAMPDSVSVVNVLRYVFAYYYGADLPPLPNTMYYSNWRYPYALLRVDDAFRAVSAGPTGPRPTVAASVR